MNSINTSAFLEAGFWCVVQISILMLLATVVLWPLSWLKRPVGSGPALSAIAMVGVLTLLSFAPLPGWWNALAKRDVAKVESPEAAPTDNEVESNEGAVNEAPNSAAPRRSKADNSIKWSEVFAKALDQTQVEPTEGASWWSWQALILLAFCASLLFGCLSLVASLLGLWRLRRTSRPVTTGALREQLDILLAMVSFRQRVEIRESDLVGGPATFGHFSPVILMPPAWRNWSESQVSAVLAHELAHIQRGDYLTHLFSQVCLAAHFYHPLMHALVGRLRLDQELAADALAVRWTGPRESYLRALAEVALALPPRSSGLAVRSFVPSRGAWVRRIEMLKSMRSEMNGMSAAGRSLDLLIMGLIALAVSTLRGPQGQSVAQEPALGAATKAPANAESLTKYVPSNADVVVVVRPGQVMTSSVGKFVEILAKGPSPISHLQSQGLELAKFEQIVVGGVIGTSTRPAGVAVFQYAEADKLQAMMPKNKSLGEVGSVSLFGLPEDGMVWGAIDGKTVIMGSTLEVTKALSGAKSSALLDRKAWNSVKSSPLAIIVKSEALRAASKSEQSPAGPTPQAELKRMLTVFGMAAPLWEEADAVALQVQVERDIQVTLHSESGSESQAQEVASTATALATLGKNFFKTLQESNQLKQPVHILLTDAARETLAKMKATTSGNAATVTLVLADKEKIAAVLPSLISNAREEAQRMASMNNMKQIALALHNYADTHGKMPPAILYGPDGKTPHSWRVALLPYMEQADLFRQYKFDEPWDSENNKKVLAKIPSTYQDPSEKGKSTNTSYFAIAGVNTMINLGAEGAGFAKVTDGTSNTIMVVDAKKDVPWTKPEDLTVDTPASMLGYDKEKFMAGLGDGSVRMIPKTIDPTMLKWLFIRDDGNQVMIP